MAGPTHPCGCGGDACDGDAACKATMHGCMTPFRSGSIMFSKVRKVSKVVYTDLLD